MPNLDQNQKDLDGLEMHLRLPGGRRKRYSTRVPVETQNAKIRAEKLSPKKIECAWRRLGLVILNFCRQQGRECPVCSIHKNEIRFRFSSSSEEVKFLLEGERILKETQGQQEYIRLVKMKTGGSAFELNHRRYSATRLTIEVIRQLRKSQISEHLRELHEYCVRTGEC